MKTTEQALSDLLKACEELLPLLDSDISALEPWREEIDNLHTAMEAPQAIVNRPRRKDYA